MKTKPTSVTHDEIWLEKPQKHDYPAAASYLKLIFDEIMVKKIVKKLKNAKISTFKAKDIFRASQLSLLGVSNAHVKKNQVKMKNGEKMSPILLVSYAGKVIIADGYHRMCAVYSFSEDASIPCQIVSV
jgi:disulfide oxidoreductase YuzD